MATFPHLRDTNASKLQQIFVGQCYVLHVHQNYTNEFEWRRLMYSQNESLIKLHHPWMVKLGLAPAK